MPASSLSSRLNRKDACRLLATSLGAAFRLPFFAIRSKLYRKQVDPAARCVHALDRDAHAIAEPDGLAGARAAQERALLVELPPLAGQLARREHPLVAVAERHERAGADQADDLAVPLLVIAPAADLGLEQEAAHDVVGAALDLHRVAFACRRQRRERVEVATAARSLLSPTDRRQQRAVTHEVGVAPDRRGEMAVVRRPQPGVPEVVGAVARLLERPQDQRRQGGAAVTGAP